MVHFEQKFKKDGVGRLYASLKSMSLSSPCPASR